MNLLDLAVSISVEAAEAEQQMKAVVDAMIDESERAEKTVSSIFDEMQQSFSQTADGGFFSSFGELLKDEAKIIEFGNIVSTGLSWIGLGLMATAEGAKKAAEQFVEYREGLALTAAPMEAMEENLAALQTRYSELMAEQEASGGYGFDLKELSAVIDAIDLQKIEMVEAVVQNLAGTYELANAQVKSWFEPFQEAEQIILLMTLP